MRSYADVPFTPKMKRALQLLTFGDNLERGVGRPTKQRLAKYGLATFDRSGDWDGSMTVTVAGRERLLEATIGREHLLAARRK